MPQDLELLKQLLVQDSEARDLPFVPRLEGSTGLVGGTPPQGSLGSISTPDLLGLSGQAQQGGNMDVMRALRGVVEGRSTDQISRGQGPQGVKGPAQGVSTAEQQPSSFNPFKVLSDALFGANSELNPPQ